MKYKNIVPIIFRFSDFFYRRHKVASPEEKLSCHPFFVFGSGRNGSTLLATILNQHKKIVVTPEEYAMPYAIIKFKLMNFLPWKKLVKIILRHFESENNNVSWRIDYSALFNKLMNLPKRERTLRRVVDEIFLFFIHTNSIYDFELWGDKTPELMKFIQYIYPVYPDSKYIFLLRDGRDVVSSIFKRIQKQSEKPEKDILDYGIYKWNKSISMYEWLKKKAHPNQLCLLRYENLVMQPETTLKNLLNFLGYEYDESMMDFQNSIDFMGVRGQSHHLNLSKPINPQSIGKWKNDLNSSQKEYILKRIHQNLQTYGYD